ncbi:hypothetical protein MSAN_00651900 [Mycena sanguinolenta]|uniref:Transmembrane protein n=1 Tax=Mycena sanguinolenta TaxID=230812 RepID=A0A8H7DG63_9AGAR|nr:hypothetical protein MSAN_00651900 [Mycena sanguinolenta]
MAVIPLVRISEMTPPRPSSITRRGMSAMVNPTKTPLLLAAQTRTLVTVNNAVTAPVINATSVPVARVNSESVNAAALAAEILVPLFFVLLLLALAFMHRTRHARVAKVWVPTSQVGGGVSMALGGQGVWVPLTKASRGDLKVTPLDLTSEYDSTAPPSPALSVTVPPPVLDITRTESIRSVSPTLVHDPAVNKEEGYTELPYLITPKPTPVNSEDGHSLDHTTTSRV